MIYHATTKTNGDKILNDHCFQPILSMYNIYNPNFKKYGKPGTLGYGLYGFYNNLDITKKFASRKIPDEPCILEFDINCDNIINFDEYEILKKYLEFIEKLKDKNKNIFERLNQLGYSNNKGYQKSLDGALIELFIKFIWNNEKVKITAILKSTVNDIDGDLSKYNLNTGIPNGIEICLRTEKIIKNDTIKKVN